MFVHSSAECLGVPADILKTTLELQYIDVLQSSLELIVKVSLAFSLHIDVTLLEILAQHLHFS